MQKKNHKTQNTIESCINCKKCVAGCAFLYNQSFSPQDVLQKKIVLAPSAYINCSSCHYCSTVCPLGIHMDDYVISKKHSFFQKKYNYFSALYRNVLFHQRISFSSFFSYKKQSSFGAYNNTVFFPGCSLCAAQPELIQKVRKYLEKKLQGINTLYSCCAHPTFTLGDMKRYKEYHKKLTEFLQGIDTIITACSNCYIRLQEQYPTKKVLSLYQYLSDQNDLIEGTTLNIKQSAALHDPCPTRYQSHIHSSVRKILKKYSIPFEEFLLNKENTVCCGSGGMLESVDPKLSLQLMQQRCSQTECELIISYCQSCVNSMEKGGKKSIHLLEVLFPSQRTQQSMTLNKLATSQKRRSRLTTWWNRYRAIQAAKQEGK